MKFVKLDIHFLNLYFPWFIFLAGVLSQESSYLFSRFLIQSLEFPLVIRVSCILCVFVLNFYFRNSEYSTGNFWKGELSLKREKYKYWKRKWNFKIQEVDKWRKETVTWSVWIWKGYFCLFHLVTLNSEEICSLLIR